MGEPLQKQWYIVHTYLGFEKKVSESLAQRVQAYGLQDEIGEIRVLRAKTSGAYTPQNMLFGEPGQEWQPPEKRLPFVRREHMLGRALVGFWPIPPFGPNRAHVIR